MTASVYHSTMVSDRLRIVRPPRPSRDYAVARLIWHVPLDAAWTREPMFPALALEALLRSASTPGRHSVVDSVEQNGVYLRVDRTHFSAQVEVRGPKHAISAAIAELAAGVARADVPEVATAVARRILAEDIDRHSRDVGLLARRALTGAYIGGDSPLGAHPEGTHQLVTDADAAAIERTLRAMSGEFPLTVICSDPDIAEVCARIVAAPASDASKPTEAAGPSLISCRAPGLARVRGGSGSGRGCKAVWGFLAEAADPEDLVAAEILVEALGGSWFSRWQQLLREELALTYGTAAESFTFRHRGRDYVLATVSLTAAPSAVDQAAAHLAEQSQRLVESGLTVDEWRETALRLQRTSGLHARSARAHVQWTARLLEGGIDAGINAVRERVLRMPEPEVLARRSLALLDSAAIAIAEGEDA